MQEQCITGLENLKEINNRGVTLHKLIKLSFNATITYFKAMQFCLMLLAFLTMIDFILSLLKIKLPPFIQIVFDIIYRIQSLIYKPDLSVIPVDFTLIVAAIEMVIMAGIIVYILNFIIEFEQLYDKVHADGVKRYEKSFNKQLEKNAVKIENKHKHFAMYYDVEVEKVNKQYSFDRTTVDPDTKRAEYRALFRNLMLQNFKVTSQQTSEGYILFFEDINDCNKAFDRLYEFISKSKETLKQHHLKFKLKASVCVADRSTDKETYLPKLKKLLNIAQPDKIMILGDFKSKYETLKEKPYKINALGEYSLANEMIDVYSMEPNRQ